MNVRRQPASSRPCLPAWKTALAAVPRLSQVISGRSCACSLRPVRAWASMAHGAEIVTAGRVREADHPCITQRLARVLLSHLRRAKHDRWRYAETQDARSLRIDDENVPCRQFDRNISWIGSLENLVDKPCGPVTHIIQIDRVGEKRTQSRILGVGVDRRNSIATCERDDLLAIRILDLQDCTAPQGAQRAEAHPSISGPVWP